MSTESITRALFDQRGQYVRNQINYAQTIVIEPGSDELEQVLALTGFQIQEPPAPKYPPSTGEFVGRVEELSRYRDQLVSNGVAVVTGVAGIGKTSLIAKLAGDFVPKTHIFWHRFGEGEEGIIELAWQLGGFLAQAGRPDIWNMLNKSSFQQPETTLSNYLIHEVSGPGYLLWFDDYQNVLDHRIVRDFIEQLAVAAGDGQLYLAITSRVRGNLDNAAEGDSLRPLNLDDTTQLLQLQGLHLPQGAIAELHRQLDGNPQLLLLAARIPTLAIAHESTIARLSEADSIERYLFRKVDDTLIEAEREVMAVTSVLMIGDTPSKRAIERLYEGPRIRRLLRDLCDRLLLTEAESGERREYGQNPVLQSFYYAGLSEEERSLMHVKAAQFYEADHGELSYLNAATHYERAGEFERAAILCTDNVWLLINQFELARLSPLLARLQEQALPIITGIQVLLTRALIAGIWGQTESACDSYIAAIDALKAEAKTPDSDRLLVNACVGLCRILLYRDPLQVLEWTDFGLTVVGGPDRAEQSAILEIARGGAFFRLGRMQEADDSLHHGLKSLGPEAGPLHAEAFVNLQALYLIQGDLERSLQYAAAAIELSNHLDNIWLRLPALSNAAPADFEIGNWAQAIDRLKETLNLAERLMDKPRQVLQLANLGEAYLRLERWRDADRYLTRALELAKDCQARSYQMAAMCTLASLRIQQEEWDPAANILRTVEDMANQSDEYYILGEVHHQWARFYFAKGATSQSSQYATDALKIAREMGSVKQEGEILHLRALIMIDEGRRGEGLKQLEQSLAILQGGDRLEEARTRLQLGLCQVDIGDIQTGKQNIAEARRVLDSLADVSI